MLGGSLMKQTIKKILEKHKSRLENKIINYHAVQSKNLILRTFNLIQWRLTIKSQYLK